MFLMSSTRCGISAKQMERELGVTYKTAWRMFNRIRSLLAETPDPMTGTVEVDETYVGGKMRGRFRSKREAARARMQNKEVVAGHVQRGGKVRAIHLPDGTAGRLLPLVHQYVLPASMVYTDELPAYTDLGGPGYKHHRVNHSAKVYVSGDVHTNTIDGFWALLKHGLRGVYHGVSAKHLQAYLDEYAFRYNHRKHHGGMFNAFLARVAKQAPAAVS